MASMNPGFRLGELNLDEVLVGLIKERFQARGEKITVVAKNIGYELRCAPPIPFDIEYTRNLGYGAIDYLRTLRAEGRNDVGAMITFQEGEMVPMPFGSFSDATTGRTRVRDVNVASESFKVALEYMIRLERHDLDDPARLASIAKAAKMTPEAFAARFGYLVGMGEAPV